MPALRSTVLCLSVVGTSLALTACDQQHAVHTTAMAGTVAANRQPLPDKSVLGAPIITSQDVLPHAKPDTHEPLPAATPLASASVPLQHDTQSLDQPQTGGVNPAAGMGAVIIDSKGAQHDADGK